MSGRPFKRMVVGSPQGMGYESAVRAAADLAEFLHIEFLAAYIADTTLLALAESPAIRELRILDQLWQPLDVRQISRGLEGAYEAARRRFEASVRDRSVKSAFDVLSSADAIAALIQAGDILAIIEPTHPCEKITRQFYALLDAAFATAATILIVPRSIVSRSGPIMALASWSTDASDSYRIGISGYAEGTRDCRYANWSPTTTRDRC
jgi:hypothetical protein